MNDTAAAPPNSSGVSTPRNHSETADQYYDAYLNDVEFQNLSTMLTSGTDGEQVQTVAAQIKSEADDLEDLLKDLRSDQKDLMGSWDGEDADEFDKKLQATIDYLDECIDDMNTHYQEIQQMGEALSTALDGAPSSEDWFSHVTDNWFYYVSSYGVPAIGFTNWLLGYSPSTAEHQDLASRMTEVSLTYDQQTATTPYDAIPGDDFPGGTAQPNPDLGAPPSPSAPGGPPPTSPPEMPTPDSSLPTDTAEYDPNSQYDPENPGASTGSPSGSGTDGLQSGGGLGAGGGLGGGSDLGTGASGTGPAGTGSGTGPGGGPLGGGRGMSPAMMGGGGGGGRGGVGGEDDHNTWLQEDEDVWGAEDEELPPGVVR